MINCDKAKTFFESYLNKNFDISKEKISHKMDHTYAVVDMAEYITHDLNLDEEDIELAKLIALLHDIGRFQQAEEFNSFKDYETLDHAKLGVKILFEENLIRKFIENNQYDEIIKKAILNHNRYQIEDGLSERQLLHSKIIRDADKTDNFRVKSVDDIYTISNVTEEEIENSLISDNIYNDFMSERTIVSRERKTAIDIWISYIAFIFDYNFISGLKYIKEKNYINKLVDRFSYKNVDTINKMEIIREFALNYIDKKLN